jgi:hypothetical protein
VVLKYDNDEIEQKSAATSRLIYASRVAPKVLAKGSIRKVCLFLGTRRGKG